MITSLCQKSIVFTACTSLHKHEQKEGLSQTFHTNILIGYISTNIRIVLGRLTRFNSNVEGFVPQMEISSGVKLIYTLYIYSNFLYIQNPSTYFHKCHESRFRNSYYFQTFRIWIRERVRGLGLGLRLGLGLGLF